MRSALLSATMKILHQPVKYALACFAPYRRRRISTATDNTTNVISQPQRIEEETNPGYKAEYFYPVHIGEVFQTRYEVVTKLGFGTSSTVWLCKDLATQTMAALKVCTDNLVTNEAEISRHIKSTDEAHPGRQCVRVALDEFKITGDFGQYQCLVFAPLGLTLPQARKYFLEASFPLSMLRSILLAVVFGLDVLHRAGIVHTDLSPNNILFGIQDSTVWSQIEQSEMEDPSPRKVLKDRIIHQSYEMPHSPWSGLPIITDFGAARLGDPGRKHTGHVMPGIYRAPEIILGMEWDSKIDLWCVGLMAWDLFEGDLLFRPVKDGHLIDELHLAQMVSLMGPPPKVFLERNEKCGQYWDSEGTWIASTPIPDQSFESRERLLEGSERELFIKFARKVLRWLPEERPSAGELLGTVDEFLDQHHTLAKTD